MPAQLVDRSGASAVRSPLPLIDHCEDVQIQRLASDARQAEAQRSISKFARPLGNLRSEESADALISSAASRAEVFDCGGAGAASPSRFIACLNSGGETGAAV